MGEVFMMMDTSPELFNVSSTKRNNSYWCILVFCVGLFLDDLVLLEEGIDACSKAID